MIALALAGKAIATTLMAASLALGGVHAAHASVGSTDGWNVTNESAALLVFEKTSGDLPAPDVAVGGVWYPGQTLNYEVPVGDQGDAYFHAYSPTGSDEGELRIHLDATDPIGGYGLLYWNGIKATPTAPSSSRPFQTGSVDSDGEYALWQNQANAIESTGFFSTSITLDDDATLPHGAGLATLLQSLCQTAGANGCEYQGDGNVTAGEGTPTPIAVAYDDTTGSGFDGTLATQSGWSTSESNTYQMNVSAGGPIAGILNVGIQRMGSKTFTVSHNFTTAMTTDLYPGDTSVIFASEPVYNVNGTFEIVLGHTKWTFENADFQYPRTDGIVTYSSSRFVGDVTSKYTVDPGVNGTTVTAAPHLPAHPAPRHSRH
ncbi:hypothetical protein [Microbacterium sp.]|uniref:hypothetical protein n=1 Tax=Microbacterium sp. TaxID=51671 RepID=UPI003A8C8E93